MHMNQSNAPFISSSLWRSTVNVTHAFVNLMLSCSTCFCCWIFHVPPSTTQWGVGSAMPKARHCDLTCQPHVVKVCVCALHLVSVRVVGQKLTQQWLRNKTVKFKNLLVIQCHGLDLAVRNLLTLYVDVPWTQAKMSRSLCFVCFLFENWKQWVSLFLLHISFLNYIVN